MVVAISKKQKMKNAAFAKAKRMKASNDTRLQTTTLNDLYVQACKAPEMRVLYSLRRCKQTKVLTPRNYSKFIILLDRLMESL